MRPWLALVALLALTIPVSAQTRQPAQITTTPTTTPQGFDLLDKTGKWMPLGTASGGAFTSFGPGADIRSFGAKCDGTTNDKPAIDAALASVAARGGGVVSVPASTTACRYAGTLAITASNVTLAGEQFGGSQILFDNGASDSIVVGTGRGTPQISYVLIRDLTLNHAAGKTGGVALSFKSVASPTVERVTVNNAWSGALFDQTNTAKIDSVILNSLTDSGGDGIDFVTAGNDPAIRSDVLAISNSTVNMRATHPGSSECLRVDGFSGNMRIKGLLLLQCGSYAFHTVNTSASSSYYPNYAEIYDLEIDGVYSEAVRLEAGNNWMFVHSSLNSIRDVNPAHAVVEIFPDAGKSTTRQVYFTASAIGNGPGSCMRINGVQNSIITGSTLANCGKYSGANGLGGSQPPVPVLEVGAQVDGLTVVGNNIGYIFGQCCAGSNNYSVQVNAGALRVLLGANNYRLFNPSTDTSGTLPLTAVNNLAGTGLMMASGGFDFDGSALGLAFSPGGSGRTNLLTLSNASTAASTASQITLATGTAGAVLLMNNADGATPTATISSGIGDIGGVKVVAGAGPASLQANGGNVQLSPSAANQVKFTNGGSFDFVASHCGTLAGATGCLVIQDNSGVVRKVPFF